MTKKFLALTLTGALTLTMLTACAPKGGEAPPAETPSVSPSESVKPTPTLPPEETLLPSETPLPTETPEAPPSETPKPSESAKPSEKPSESVKPSEKPSPSPETPAAPSETPKPEKSVVQSIWDKVSSQERPSLMDLDAAALSSLYGIESGDLVEYVAKMPMMSAHVTEFLIAKVAPGKMDSVKKACQDRQAYLAADTLYPETTKLVESYKLVTSGDYILFAIDEHAADMVEAFNTLT